MNHTFDKETWADVMAQLMKIAETPQQIELLTKISSAQVLGDVSRYETLISELRAEHRKDIDRFITQIETYKDVIKMLTDTSGRDYY